MPELPNSDHLRKYFRMFFRAYKNRFSIDLKWFRSLDDELRQFENLNFSKIRGLKNRSSWTSILDFAVIIMKYVFHKNFLLLGQIDERMHDFIDFPDAHQHVEQIENEGIL